MHKYNVGEKVIIRGAQEVPILEIKELIAPLDNRPLYKCGLPGWQFPINILTTLAEDQLEPAQEK
ncbi:hypothetical protein [Nostoc sp. FACHB-133]|uniref:hypothetical protein n=1 Tax=Nostoc sp. FACHB-133 TaxID=2692835 RepID=UPI00168306D6|nr:hypothetical protein [Nostoc sp. FACHB-133]MBD2527659.1 hypothetical protein [Nostoc sp. FACHB-133]